MSALVLVHHLSLLSLSSLLTTYKRLGPISIHYLRASPNGLRLASLLRRIGLAHGSPAKIIDGQSIDTTYNQFCSVERLALMACHAKLARIEEITGACLPHWSGYYQDLCSANIVKSLTVQLRELMNLCIAAERLANTRGISVQRVVVVSVYTALFDALNPNSCRVTIVPVLQQPTWGNFKPFAAMSILHAVRQAGAALRDQSSIAPSDASGAKVGTAAVWGTDAGRRNDFFWWYKSGILADRLVYLFDRPSYQATADRIQKTRALGVAPAVLNRHAVGEETHLLVEDRPTLSEALRTMFVACRLTLRALFSDRFVRSVITSIYWQCAIASKLAVIYTRLGLRAVSHYQDVGSDYVVLAAESVGVIRFGVHWSCIGGPCGSALRTHHVFFLWGPHDAKVCLDSKSISPYLLLAGCPMDETISNQQAVVTARYAASEMRRQGARYILALFDTSFPTPHFYRFFLQWLLEDPALGLIIKSKHTGEELEESMNVHGLAGSVDQAMATGRIHMLYTAVSPSDSTTLRHPVSPSDAALASDFSVGIGSPSAMVESALRGARVLYLDYERLDQGPLKPYATLHSLGTNRCVFYEPDALKHAVQQYAKNPASNPHLGDASPILDRFDPFRDGKAGERIGEYVRWYLEGVDKGLSRDNALKCATRNYADKWGEDKVVRGL